MKGRFLFLDGLRAVAAIAVMLFHFFNHWVSPIHDSLAAMLPRGMQIILEHADMGVEVFFVLSGFVIAHSLFDKTITTGFAGNFVLRRSMRLDPPYWVVIVLSIALPYLLIPRWSQNLFTQFGGTTGVLINMFYLPDLLWQPRIIGVAWTLCLEVQFYLAFLLLLWAFHAIRNILSDRNHWIAIGIVGAAFALLAAYSVYQWFGIGTNNFSGRWFMFFTGVLAYWALAGRVDRRIFLGYLLAMVGLCVALREPRSAVMLTTTAVIYGSTLAGGLQRWLSGKAFQYLGRISYSLYLVHMTAGVAAIRLALHFLGGSHVAALAAMVVAIVVSILLAELLNRFVELPAMRLGKSFKTSEKAAAGGETLKWPRLEPALATSFQLSLRPR